MKILPELQVSHFLIDEVKTSSTALVAGQIKTQYDLFLALIGQETKVVMDVLNSILVYEELQNNISKFSPVLIHNVMNINQHSRMLIKR